jgi:hypothetical protein
VRPNSHSHHMRHEVDDCASARHCRGSTVGTCAGRLRCRPIWLSGSHEETVIARIWRRWRLPMTISIRLEAVLLIPLTLDSRITAEQRGQYA